jgi:hypothetical protein
LTATTASKVLSWKGIAVTSAWHRGQGRGQQHRRRGVQADHQRLGLAAQMVDGGTERAFPAAEVEHVLRAALGEQPGDLVVWNCWWAMRSGRCAQSSRLERSGVIRTHKADPAAVTFRSK